MISFRYACSTVTEVPTSNAGHVGPADANDLVATLTDHGAVRPQTMGRHSVVLVEAVVTAVTIITPARM